MDFTALRYFSETAHLGSVRAASERLHISPSAISRQIAKLEHELRTAMFDRRADGMKLTAAGEILQSKVEAMVRAGARQIAYRGPATASGRNRRLILLPDRGREFRGAGAA